MSQYQIIENDLIKELVPPNKRTDIHLHWLYQLIGSQMQRLNDLQFDSYDKGILAGFYSAITVYNIGDRIYSGAVSNNNILECNTNGTTGTFDITKWDYLLPNNIGYEERLPTRANRMEFEWALNRHFESEFGTIFRQPDTLDTVRSDIYILDNIVFEPTIFELGFDDISSSFIPLDDEGPWMGLDPTIYPTGTLGSFTIYYPTSMMTGYLTVEIERFIRNFADNIVYASEVYNISGY